MPFLLGAGAPLLVRTPITFSFFSAAACFGGQFALVVEGRTLNKDILSTRSSTSCCFLASSSARLALRLVQTPPWSVPVPGVLGIFCRCVELGTTAVFIQMWVAQQGSGLYMDLADLRSFCDWDGKWTDGRSRSSDFIDVECTPSVKQNYTENSRTRHSVRY